MKEPTEEEKQAVIAYFKSEGFSLYKVEGLDKLDKELIEARAIIKQSINLNKRLNKYAKNHL